MQIQYIFLYKLYSKSSSFDGPDLRCFEVTNALHTTIKENTVIPKPLNIGIKKYSTWSLLAFVIWFVNDVNYYDYERMLLYTHFTVQHSMFRVIYVQMFRFTHWNSGSTVSQELINVVSQGLRLFLCLYVADRLYIYKYTSRNSKLSMKG